LVGVDSAYFHALIEALEHKQAADGNFIMTSDYISEIIDRIFN